MSLTFKKKIKHFKFGLFLRIASFYIASYKSVTEVTIQFYLVFQPHNNKNFLLCCYLRFINATFHLTILTFLLRIANVQYILKSSLFIYFLSQNCIIKIQNSVIFRYRVTITFLICVSIYLLFYSWQKQASIDLSVCVRERVCVYV